MTINESAEILKEVLEEITNFENDESQLDFILDVVNGFKEKAKSKHCHFCGQIECGH
jgi:hypothetical protein